MPDGEKSAQETPDQYKARTGVCPSGYHHDEKGRCHPVAGAGAEPKKGDEPEKEPEREPEPEPEPEPKKVKKAKKVSEREPEAEPREVAGAVDAVVGGDESARDAIEDGDKRDKASKKAADEVEARRKDRKAAKRAAKKAREGATEKELDTAKSEYEDVKSGKPAKPGGTLDKIMSGLAFVATVGVFTSLGLGPLGALVAGYYAHKASQSAMKRWTGEAFGKPGIPPVDTEPDDDRYYPADDPNANLYEQDDDAWLEDLHDRVSRHVGELLRGGISDVDLARAVAWNQSPEGRAFGKAQKSRTDNESVEFWPGMGVWTQLRAYARSTSRS